MPDKFVIAVMDLYPRYNPADQPLMDELRAIAERVNGTAKALRVHIGEILPDEHTPIGWIHHYDADETLVHREDWTTAMRVLKAWFP